MRPARLRRKLDGMRSLARKVALVAVSAVLIACSVETGDVLVAVSCEGDGCGQEGTLISRVKDCDEGIASYGEKEARVMLGTASTFAFAFENILAGDRCVQTFLDVDTSGNLSAGDIVSSEAIEQGVGEDDDDEDDDTDDAPELDVDVEEDGDTEVDAVLDTVVPAQF